ncbi:uncharacterized protein LOC111744944 isoform X2 [Pteropus vampyrus]|uniref:Uncharacterized protein LOC111744944 isoform X2 n=1 Tax=Pteropus vampyrus TaxID=132908 RepID=A0A6P6CV64_PTEVA|nr:uncharacterized protein LOC111744944 isoform X2 [Pteropus vampyrus]
MGAPAREFANIRDASRRRQPRVPGGLSSLTHPPTQHRHPAQKEGAGASTSSDHWLCNPFAYGGARTHRGHRHWNAKTRKSLRGPLAKPRRLRSPLQMQMEEGGSEKVARGFIVLKERRQDLHPGLQPVIYAPLVEPAALWPHLAAPLPGPCCLPGASPDPTDRPHLWALRPPRCSWNPGSPRVSTIIAGWD